MAAAQRADRHRLLRPDPVVVRRVVGAGRDVRAAAGCGGGGVEVHRCATGRQYAVRPVRPSGRGRIRAAIGDAAFDRAFELGAGYSLDQAVALALGGETPQAPAARTGLAGRLTEREYEIAVLLGDGLSNREIAARLVISQRTAETHVERILRKLAFTSRAQVARWIRDHPHT